MEVNKKIFFLAAAILFLKPFSITRAADNIEAKVSSMKTATSSEALKPVQVSEENGEALKDFTDDILVSIKSLGSSSSTGNIIFYMTRDMKTNLVLHKPEPVRVTLTLKECCAALSGINIKGSRKEITVSNVSGSTLSQNNSVSFDVDFWSEELADGSVTMVKGAIDIMDSSQSIRKEIPVIASADGLYSYYNSEFASTFNGSLIHDGAYCNIGQVNLKSSNAPTLTIKHLWKPIAASEAYPLNLIQLEPDGYFEFPDGSYERTAQRKDEGYVEFQIRMKESAFHELKAKTVAQNRNIYQFVPLSELVFIYEGPKGEADGFMIGGKGASLPITYLLTYTAHTSSSGGGSSSGGSGGGGGGSTTIVDTSTYNVAREGDNGWKPVDNTWYYYDSNNKIVKGWLLTLDNKWYYMD